MLDDKIAVKKAFMTPHLELLLVEAVNMFLWMMKISMEMS